MGKYPPYPEYEESSIEWLGDIPSHWETKRLKDIATYNDEALAETTDPDYELKYIEISSVDFVQGIIDQENVTFRNAPSRARRKVRDGDTIISTVRTYLRAIAAIRNPPDNLIVSTGFAVVRPKQNQDPDYVGYLLQSEGFVGDVVAHSVGVSYPAVNASVLACLPVLEPPLPEQQAIARFLDRKTTQIDALIAKKEALLAKLAEKRTALISQAVTKGLDPSVPMKDSGVEWLGEIPAGWQIVRFRYYCTITQGQVDPRDSQFSDRVLIAPNHIESGTGRILYTESAAEQVAISGKYLVRSGEIIYSKIRPELNKVCIARGDWLCSADMYPVRAGPGIQMEYLLYFFLSEPFVRLMVDESMRVAMPKVNRETLSASPLLLPPFPEQQVIVRFLDHKTAQIDALIAKIQSAIDKLKEYRTALITHAVTGKIDVHAVALTGVCSGEELEMEQPQVHG